MQKILETINGIISEDFAPSSKWECNNCDYESSTTVLWGGFNYVLKEEHNLINENVEREYGWCYDCEYICPIEIIPTIDSLEIKIEK